MHDLCSTLDRRPLLLLALGRRLLLLPNLLSLLGSKLGLALLLLIGFQFANNRGTPLRTMALQGFIGLVLLAGIDWLAIGVDRISRPLGRRSIVLVMHDPR